MRSDIILASVHGRALLFTLGYLCTYFSNDVLETLNTNAPLWCDNFYDMIHYTQKAERVRPPTKEEWSRCLPFQPNQENYPDIQPDQTRELGDLIVYDILGTCKIRIGSIGDGGYVLVE